MKYYEFVVIKDGIMCGSYNHKQGAADRADCLRAKFPDSRISIKAHVYGKPLNAWDVGESYLYSYDVR